MILWERQLKILRFLSEELGNIHWTGTSANRQRRQHKEEYLRHQEQPRASLEAIKLARSKRKEDNLSYDMVPAGDAFINSLQEAL